METIIHHTSQTVTIYERTYGTDHLETATQPRTLALFPHEHGAYREAETTTVLARFGRLSLASIILFHGSARMIEGRPMRYATQGRDAEAAVNQHLFCTDPHGSATSRRLSGSPSADYRNKE